MGWQHCAQYWIWIICRHSAAIPLKKKMALSEINFILSNFSCRFQIFFRISKKRVMFLDMAITTLVLSYWMNLCSIESYIYGEKIILNTFYSLTFFLKMLSFHEKLMKWVLNGCSFIPTTRRNENNKSIKIEFWSPADTTILLKNR